MLKTFNSHHNGLIMASRFFAFIIWAAVAASIAYWGLRWLAPQVGVPASATSVKLGGQVPGDFRRLFASATTADEGPAIDPSAASQLLSRIRVIGAVAPGTPSGDDGVALLSLDGKPARAVKIGQTIDGDMVLLALNQRQAEIGPMGGPTLARIDLPRLSPAATSTLPPPSGATLNPPPSAVPPPPAMPPAATPPDNPEPPPGPDGES